ncbi:MAG: extracellular solute-binding protein [Ardenticatenaceae bacterium]|nr:extracellular solute-binding protein [Anaerolineales bacterium]MCB8921772.1 extracellular solute-binding protein [Ardenticatenaceae bacterium]MCB8990709.1 extracellular solute-binding protein [Ardenticatenaceae bacterium]
MKKRIKRLRGWLIGIVWVVLLAACQTSTPETAVPTPTPVQTAADEPVELVVWAEYFTQNAISTDPDGAGAYGRYLKEQFEKEHPGVTVRIEYHGWDTALQQNLFNALLAGTPPDIVVGENYFQLFAELGALVPLDNVMAEDVDNLIPGTYKAAEYEGHIYGLSAFTGVFGFERNCAVVEAAGLDCDNPPQTWDELLAEVQQITAVGNGEYYGYTLQGPGESSTIGGIFRVAAFLAQVDAPICRNNCTEPYFNNPQAIQVMEFIRELHRSAPPGLAFNPHEGQVYEQLFRGLSAYQIAGSWHPQWAKDIGCEDCRYSPIPVPENGRAASMVVGNVIYAVLQQSQHQDLAMEWVHFLVRDDVQDLVYPSLGRLPATRSALTRLRPMVTPAEQAFIDQLLETPNLEILPQWRKEPQLLWEIYNEMLAEILTTERPIIEIMDEAQAKAEEVLQ